MPMQEVENISQGRPIHIDTTLVLPGQKALIDSERAKSKPVQALVAANELKLGATVDDGDDEPAPKPQAAPQPPKPPNPPAKG